MFIEVFLILLGAGLFVALLVCTLVLPIVAYVRTRGLDRRLQLLEKELKRLRTEKVSAAAPEAAEEAAVSIPVADIPMAVEVVEAAPVPKPRKPRTKTSGGLEEWLGGRGLGWAAVVLLLFAAAFFFQQMFERDLIGSLGRVGIGVALGVGLCFAGMRLQRRGWPIYSQMMTAAGAVLLFLSVFASFGFYHLLPRQTGGIFLVIVVVEVFALALLYEAPAIALMGVIGGLLTPVLLHADRDQYVNLFLYLTVLNAGVVGLSLFRRWPAIGTVALVGSQVLFWGWFNGNYHPAKLTACLAFQGGLFGLYMLQALLGTWLGKATLWPNWIGLGASSKNDGQQASTEDLVRTVLTGFFLAAAGYVLLDPDYHPWLATLCLLPAMVYTAAAWFVFAYRPRDERQFLVLFALAMGFVAMVFPLQIEGAFITVGWAVQGLVLWWFGLRVAARGLRGIGAALLVIAVVRLVFVDTLHGYPKDFFLPIFNAYGGPALAVAACVLAAGLAGRRFQERLTPADRLATRAAGLGGVVLIWFVLSRDIYGFFIQTDFGYDPYRIAQTAMSVLWAAFAAVILAIGFRLPSRPLRWLSLGLFGLTLGKVMLVDIAYLPGFYRVAAFLALSIAMAGAAWGYQKMKHRFMMAEPGEEN